MKRKNWILTAVAALFVTASAFSGDARSLTFKREQKGRVLVSTPENTYIKSLTDLPDGSVSTSLTFTVEFWAKLAGNPAEIPEQDVLSQYLIKDDGRLIVGFKEGKLCFYLGRAMTGTDVLETNRWYHIAFTRDSQGTKRGYVDGAEVSLTPQRACTYPLSEAPIQIGALSYSIAETEFNGDLSELRVWDVCRTKSEIAAARFIRMTGTEPGLLYCWPFDDGTGTVCRERVSGNDAKIEEAETVVWNDEEPSFRLPTRKHALNVQRGNSDSSIWVGPPAGTRIPSDSLPFTVEFWFKLAGDPLDSALQEQDLFNQYEGRHNARMFVGVNGGKLYFFMGSKRLAGTTVLTSGKWYHAAFVRGADASMSLYLNGVRDTEVALANGYYLPEADIEIASLHYSGNPTAFNGQVSEMRVWRVARTAEQIAASMTERADGTEEGLLYCWPFDDGEGALCRERVAGRHALIYKTTHVSWTEELPPPFRIGFQIILR